MSQEKLDKLAESITRKLAEKVEALERRIVDLERTCDQLQYQINDLTDK